MSVTVEYSGTSGFNQFKGLAALVKWADYVGPELREALKDKAPVGTGPGAGRLRDSIRYERETTGEGITVTFTAHAPYARYVIEGTAPHEIRAKAARALHWGGVGGEHFAKVVHHPGTQPNNFPERALLPLEPMIQRELSTILQEELGA